MSTLLVAIVSVILGFVFIGGIDTLATLVNFGALSAFLLLNVSVFYHFIIKKKRGDYWNYLILPFIGFKIGRASCRERMQRSVVARYLKNKSEIDKYEAM